MFMLSSPHVTCETHIWNCVLKAALTRDRNVGSHFRVKCFLFFFFRHSFPFILFRFYIALMLYALCCSCSIVPWCLNGSQHIVIRQWVDVVILIAGWEEIFPFFGFILDTISLECWNDKNKRIYAFNVGHDLIWFSCNFIYSLKTLLALGNPISQKSSNLTWNMIKYHLQ